MRKAIFLLALLLTAGAAPASAYAAKDTELELKVLPMNCVFEYVNDGSNKILYMTPKECGLHLGQNKNPNNDSATDLPRLQGESGLGFLDSLGPLDEEATAVDDPEGQVPVAVDPEASRARAADGLQAIGSQKPWANPVVIGTIVGAAIAGVAVDAIFFGFSGVKLAAGGASNGFGLVRRLVRFLLRF